MGHWRKIQMARLWQVNESDCSKIHLLHGSDDDDAIWLENTWHEVSPIHAATLPSDTKMLDADKKALTLLDGYCTTYFYKGWQTVIPMNNKASGEIISNNLISGNVGEQVAKENSIQVVRLRDQFISLPDNLGNNLIPDLYPGSKWRYTGNWQGTVPPLYPDGGQVTVQEVSFPRTFTIDETHIPGYGTATNKSYYAPELFWPYMCLLERDRPDGSYIGGLIMVIGVKKLS